MGLVIALAWHAVMGGLCAYRARLYLESRGEIWGLPFLVALSAAGLVGGPASVFLFRFHGAFFVHYFDNPAAHPEIDTWGFPISVGVLTAMGVATTLGFRAVRYAVEKMHAPYCLAPAAGVALVALIFAGIFWNRVFLVGDFDQFAAGALRPIWGHMAGALVVLPVCAGVVAAHICGRWFIEEKGTMPPVAVR